MATNDETAAAKRGASGGVERLRSFLETKMAMSHVYQPVMIRTILEGGGAATRRQVAAAFLAADLSQLEYYENVVSRYPGPVLRRHGIVELERGVYRLTAAFRRMDEWQRATLVALCDAKVAEYISQRQAAIWMHRSGNVDPVPGSLRWQVITRAMGRCEACGVSSEIRALEVDHIKPRSQGGGNELTNLQALCSLCNVQKLDRDETDFHAAHLKVKQRREGCQVCTAMAGVPEELAAVAHLPIGSIVAPRRHGVSWIELWQPEVNALRRAEAAAEVPAGASMVAQMLGRGDDDPGHLVLSYEQ
jgi:5-methylcytosine-specific restriction endonuclease McrA